MKIIPGYIAFVIGAAAMVMQVLLLREFLAIFSGNELIVGAILANWLLITGIAAILSRLIKNVTAFHISASLLVCAVYQPLSVFLIRYIKGQIYPGIALGFTSSFVFSFLILLPFCVCSALILTSLSRIKFNNRTISVSYVYFWDTVGALLGSIIFTFFLSSNFPALQVTAMLSLLIIHALVILHTRQRALLATILSLFALTALIVIAIFPRLFQPLEIRSLSYLFPQQKIIGYVNAPYGQLVFSENGKQLTAYQNGQVIGAENDFISAEESVHYPLSQHPAPRTVLLVGGGLNGSLLELNKYPLKNIDYVDLDISIIRAAQDLYKNSISIKTNWIQSDVIQFLTKNINQYDVILISSPPPDSAQANRYYTKEFFSLAKDHLNPNGILSFGIPRSENYNSDSYRAVASSINNSLKKVFPYQKVIPGEKLYFIASESDLLPDITASLKNKNIYTTYVNENYLRGILTRDRLNNIQEAFTIKNLYNSNNRPITYLVQINHWLKQFGDNLLFPFLLLLACLTSLVFISYKTPSPSFYTAFSATSTVTMGLELLLLIALQVAYGSLYQQTALIFAAFMLGAAMGASACSYKTIKVKQWFSLLDLLAILLCVALGISFQGGTFAPSPFIFYGLTALCGLIIGGQFGCLCQIVSNLGKSNDFIATTTFAVDFIAAAIGALLIGTFLIPLFGLANVAYTLAGIKLFIFLYLALANIIPVSKSLSG